MGSWPRFYLTTGSVSTANLAFPGSTARDAAATIGIPVGTAKSRLHYATDALRAALDADARLASSTRAMA